MNIKVLAALLLIAAVVGIGVFTLLPTQEAQTQPTTTEQQTTATTPVPRPGGRVSLTLYLNDYGYNASKGGPRITAYVGDTIVLRLIGNGSGPIVHDFVLDEGSPSPYNVKSERLRRGQEQVIEFVANHPGIYSYYCSVRGLAGPSHRERGQEGTIEILERT